MIEQIKEVRIELAEKAQDRDEKSRIHSRLGDEVLGKIERNNPKADYIPAGKAP